MTRTHRYICYWLMGLLTICACRLKQAPVDPNALFALATDTSDTARFRFFFYKRDMLLRFDCPASMLASVGNQADRLAALSLAEKQCLAIGPRLKIKDLESKLEKSYLKSIADQSLNRQEQMALRDVTSGISTQLAHRLRPVFDPQLKPFFDPVRSRFMLRLDELLDNDLNAISTSKANETPNQKVLKLQSIRFDTTWDEGSVFYLHLPNRVDAKDIHDLVVDVRGIGPDNCGNLRVEALDIVKSRIRLRINKQNDRAATCRLLLRKLPSPTGKAERPTDDLGIWNTLWTGVRNAWPWMNDKERRQFELALGSEWKRSPKEHESALTAKRSEELFYANRKLLLMNTPIRAHERSPNYLPQATTERLQTLTLSDWAMEWERYLNERPSTLHLPLLWLDQALSSWLTANGYQMASESCVKTNRQCYQWQVTWLGRSPSVSKSQRSFNATGFDKLTPPLKRLILQNAN